MTLTEKMVRAMIQGLGEEAKKTGQRLNNLAAIVGSVLSPVLKALFQNLGAGVVAMQGRVREKTEPVKGILAAGLGSTAAVAAALLNLAAWSNPITWAVSGIVPAVLVAACVRLVANWGKGKGW